MQKPSVILMYQTLLIKSVLNQDNSLVLNPWLQWYTLNTCGVRNRKAKERCLETLNFQHFAKFTTFTTDGDDFRNKVLKDKIPIFSTFTIVV